MLARSLYSTVDYFIMEIEEGRNQWSANCIVPMTAVRIYTQYFLGLFCIQGIILFWIHEI